MPQHNSLQMLKRLKPLFLPFSLNRKNILHKRSVLRRIYISVYLLILRAARLQLNHFNPQTSKQIINLIHLLNPNASSHHHLNRALIIDQRVYKRLLLLKLIFILQRRHRLRQIIFIRNQLVIFRRRLHNLLPHLQNLPINPQKLTFCVSALNPSCLSVSKA